MNSFHNLPHGTVFRAFAFFKFTPDADPLVFVFIDFFFDAVQHQIIAAVFQITEGSVSHIDHPKLLYLYRSQKINILVLAFFENCGMIH